MAIADVLVLHLTGSDPEASPGSELDAAAEPAADPGLAEGDAPAETHTDAITPAGPDRSDPVAPDGGATASTTVAGTWPAEWLPGLLAAQQEEMSDDGLVHRYLGARVLYAAGARLLDVTASPSDPTTVRLTVVWGDDAPPAGAREEFLTWWTAQAGGQGWGPIDVDDLVGPVLVARYEPAETYLDTEGGTQVVLHEWAPPSPDPTTGRTSGRRT